METPVTVVSRHASGTAIADAVTDVVGSAVDGAVLATDRIVPGEVGKVRVDVWSWQGARGGYASLARAGLGGGVRIGEGV